MACLINYSNTIIAVKQDGSPRFILLLRQ